MGFENPFAASQSLGMNPRHRLNEQSSAIVIAGLLDSLGWWEVLRTSEHILGDGSLAAGNSPGDRSLAAWDSPGDDIMAAGEGCNLAVGLMNNL